jgi:hypothetical protein
VELKVKKHNNTITDVGPINYNVMERLKTDDFENNDRHRPPLTTSYFTEINGKLSNTTICVGPVTFTLCYGIF